MSWEAELYTLFKVLLKGELWFTRKKMMTPMIAVTKRTYSMVL